MARRESAPTRLLGPRYKWGNPTVLWSDARRSVSFRTATVW